MIRCQNEEMARRLSVRQAERREQERAEREAAERRYQEQDEEILRIFRGCEEHREQQDENAIDAGRICKALLMLAALGIATVIAFCINIMAWT